MRIVECDDTHRAGWNQFVSECADASFYHRYEWRDVNTRCFGHRTSYLGAFEGERLVGVFPLVQLKSRVFGNIACSMPFVNYGGPCGANAEIERALIAESKSVIEIWGARYLEIRSCKHLGDDLPTASHKVSMALDLEADPDRVFSRFKPDHRRDIKRAYKNGFAARFGRHELLDDFYTVLSESWRDLGTPIYAKHYLRTILDTFGEANRICVVYHDGEPAAAAFDGSHRGTMEGMWLGMRRRFRNLLVGYVLYWELIKHSCEHGFSRFHLGRSTSESGGEVFKRKWNAQPRQLYWHYVLRTVGAIPQLNVQNPKYRFAIESWRRLPVGVTQIVGPLLARNIP